MGRILFWLLLGAVVWWLVRAWSGGHQRRRGQSGGVQGAPSETAESLVACRQCGVRLPKSSALLAEPGYFCCKQHRDAYQAQGQDGH